MREHDVDTVLDWRGRKVHAPGGDDLGRIGDLFLGPGRERVEYVEVKTGLLGRHRRVVPLAALSERDGDVHAPWDQSTLDAGPELEPGEAVTEAQARLLARHYGAGIPASDDQTLVRAEEEATIGRGEMQPTERVRVRKVTVTEEVPTTVPVRKEVVRLEHEPPPPGAVESVEDLAPDDPREAGHTREL